MKYMLDTNTCIFILKRNEGALRKFHAASSDGVTISAITLAELMYGVAKSTRKAYNAANIAAFLALVEVLPFDIAATNAYGEIRAALERFGNGIDPLDLLIAAHARSESLTLVTNNSREFQRVSGLSIEDWLV